MSMLVGQYSYVNYERSESMKTVMDIQRLQSFRGYHEKYYNQAFQSGQGTEQILKLLANCDFKGDWLDLGCGTNTLFWAIPLLKKAICSITVSDLYPEALHVLGEFKDSADISPCYKQVMQMFEVSVAEISNFRKRDWNFVCMNALQPWTELSHQTFDLITQLGCFGVAPMPEDFLSAVIFAVRHLRSNGVLVSANWKRSDVYVSQYGGDNSYLSPQLIETLASADSDWQILYNEKILIANDPLYDFVLLWAVKNTKKR